MQLEDKKRLGYVSLFRSMLEWEWFKDSSTLHIFIYCLLKANHKDKKYKGDVVKRGSFLTSRKLIAEETGLTEQKVRTALNHLKSTNELTISTSSKGTIVSINNYDKFQRVTNDLTNKQPTTNQRSTINNNDNNINNGGGTPYTTDFLKFWSVYKKHGFKEDCFKAWQEMDLAKEDIELIIFSAREYSREMMNDYQHMLFPRTFLLDGKWNDYLNKFKIEKTKLQEREELDAYYNSIPGMREETERKKELLRKELEEIARDNRYNN